MKEKKVIVSLKGISKTYDNDVKVVKNIDLDIYEGEFLTILGASGCGKTTTLRMIAGFEDVSSGDICIDGSSVIGVPPYKRQVNTAFQSYALFPHLNVYDNIAYGPRVHGMKDKSKLDAIVEESLRGAAIFDEVKDRLKKSALGLSGGQQQRICIARALAVQPEVLLMDEPTSALDPISTSKIEELMEDLKKKYTVVVVTHNMQQAVRVSDDTAFFLVGEMVEFGDTKTIFSYPKDKRTEDYITGRFG